MFTAHDLSTMGIRNNFKMREFSPLNNKQQRFPCPLKYAARGLRSGRLQFESGEEESL
jgi:hypothetical protein